MTKAKEMRDQSLEELEASCEDNRKTLFDLMNERKKGGSFTHPHRIHQTKKEIARLLTIIGEKQRQSKGR